MAEHLAVFQNPHALAALLVNRKQMEFGVRIPAEVDAHTQTIVPTEQVALMQGLVIAN